MLEAFRVKRKRTFREAEKRKRRIIAVKDGNPKTKDGENGWSE